MVKFLTTKSINSETKNIDDNNINDYSNSINIKVKSQPVKIGKYSFDENIITRVSIVK